MKLIVGLLLAICVGIGCRWFGIPLPGPPAIMGAAMAVAMATGYTSADYLLTRKSPPAETTIHSATGQSPSHIGDSVKVTAIHLNQDKLGT